MDTQKPKEKIINIPNVLAMIRMLMVPVVIWQICKENMITALLLFFAACMTDVVDGYIARHYNQVTDFGKFLDPLADKLLVIAAMAMFCEWGSFPAWALMIVLTREFAVSGLRMVAGPKGKVIAAGWSGKVKTFSTMVGLCVMMAFPQVSWIGITVMVVIVTTTLYSGVEYFIQNWNCLWD